MSRRLVSYLTLLVCALSTLLSAKVIGTNVPAQPLTDERVSQLPKDQQAPWRAYLDRSKNARSVDQRSLSAELEGVGRKEAIPAPKGHNASLPLDNAAAWYGTAEAVRIAEIVVTYQLPSGGWSKNLSMVKEPRPRGGSYSGDVVTRDLAKDDNDAGLLSGWSYIGTYDNDATTSQLRFLARVVAKAEGAKTVAFKEAFARGMEFIFASQYPNGGFPQVWPLMGGYHDSITLNDGAMIHIIAMLEDVAAAAPDFAWVPAEIKTQAAQRAAQALQCLLACQVRVNGRLKVWCQQYDVLTLAPTSARNYEMPSLSAGESAEITLFLMQRKNPTPEMVAAVHAAAAWYTTTALRGVEFVRQADGRRLVPSTDKASVLWARYYDLTSDRPLFGDRDKTIHDDVNEISAERRNGYAWFGNGGTRVLEQYAKWPVGARDRRTR